MALYRPPARLRPSHKELLKTIWSFQQRYDGTNVECFACHKVKPFDDITVHHSDGVDSHNGFGNLSPACWSCNGHESWLVRRRKMAMQRGSGIRREREGEAQSDRFDNSETIQNASSALEGIKHIRMKNNWNEWIRGKASIPSQDEYPFPLLRGLPSGIKLWEKARKIARIAEQACGEGSNKTYFDYLESNIEQGLFKSKVVNGEILICYSDEFEDIVRAHIEIRRPLEDVPLQNVEMRD